MPKISLSVAEIDELIQSYKSSLKKMRFQIVQVNEAISGLQELKKDKLETREAKRVAKTQTKATAAKKPGRKKTRKRRKRKTEGYRLSDWDKFLIETIRNNDKPMTSAELLEAAVNRAKKQNLEFDENQLKGKVARSLQKLANKRSVLGKASSRGKGYVYGLGDWFFARSGRLKKAYLV